MVESSKVLMLLVGGGEAGRQLTVYCSGRDGFGLSGWALLGLRIPSPRLCAQVKSRISLPPWLRFTYSIAYPGPFGPVGWSRPDASLIACLYTYPLPLLILKIFP
jgi:hypothetical protein